MILTRRSLITSGAVFLAAPAIVRVASLMPIKVPAAELYEWKCVSVRLEALFPAMQQWWAAAFDQYEAEMRAAMSIPLWTLQNVPRL